jgi:hypothetical protein
MGICRDKYVEFLNDLGFNVVRLLRTGIEPLQLIGRQNGATGVLGELSQLVESSTKPLPKVTANLTAANINGQQTDALDAALGVHLLGSFIGAMGGKLGLKASYSQARSLTFTFNDVTLDRVLALDVGQYLQSAAVNADNVVLREYVLGNGDLFLITEVIRSTSFSVSAESKSGSQLEVEVPAIQDIVGGDVKVTGDGTKASVVTYSGKLPLAFGFSCVQVGVAGGHLSVESIKPGQATSLYVGGPSAGSTLLSSNGLLQLSAGFG